MITMMRISVTETSENIIIINRFDLIGHMVSSEDMDVVEDMAVVEDTEDGNRTMAAMDKERPLPQHQQDL